MTQWEMCVGHDPREKKNTASQHVSVGVGGKKSHIGGEGKTTI